MLTRACNYGGVYNRTTLSSHKTYDGYREIPWAKKGHEGLSNTSVWTGSLSHKKGRRLVIDHFWTYKDKACVI